MPEPLSEPYAYRLSKSADISRSQLPPELGDTVWQVIQELAQNPDAHPDLTDPLTSDGRLQIYKHPRPPLQITYEINRDKHVLQFLHFVAPKVRSTKQVFISYCHEDAEWLTKLKQFLRPLEAQGLIKVWDDTEIKTGSKWLEDIAHELESANVAVLLVTQNFMDSPFIQSNELPRILEKAEKRGCQIFWIAVNESSVDRSAIAKFQAANDPAQPLAKLLEPEQDRVFMQIYDRMKSAVKE